MLPIFLSIYRLNQSKAVATSLLAVGLSSLSSLIIQISNGAEFKIGTGLIFLLIGIFSAVIILKKISEKMEKQFLVRGRQLVFTLVVVLALAKIFQA